MERIARLLWSAPFLALSLPAFAQNRADATLYTRASPGEIRAAVQIQIDDGWHLYHEDPGPPEAAGLPTTVELMAEGVVWSKVRFPAPRKHDVPALESWNWVHEGELTVFALGSVQPGATPGPVTAEVKGLTCEDEGICVPYDQTVGSSGPGPDEVFAAFPADIAAGGAENGSAKRSPGGVTSAGKSAPGERTEDGVGLGQFLLEAVAWGIFTLLMPCTYPMIPITISFFTKQASARASSVLPLVLCYGAGIVAVFIAIGVAFGSVIIPFATHPLTNLAFGLVFVLFSLVLFGWFELQPPRILMNAAGQASRSGGYAGVFLMGSTLVVTSFTCTAPFVGTLLARGAQAGGLDRVVLGMGVFGLTMAVPFALLALLPGRLRALPRSGEWMHTLKVFLGFVEVAAALKFFSNTDLVWSWGVLSRELFLVLWLGIFLVAALFLLGLVRLNGESPGIGPGRMIAGLLTLLFALYCGYGATGRELDKVMTAIAPPYSHLLVGGTSGGAQPLDRHTIVADDFDGARKRAIAEQKLLMVNFTGYT